MTLVFLYTLLMSFQNTLVAYMGSGAGRVH